jgi:putative SOS response-associated peptidase YedK
VGLSACPAQGSARHQFPFRRSTVPDWSLSDTGITFFEFTGRKSPKTKWKFTKAGEDWFCFAGLWRPMTAGGAAFTLLTTHPSPDVAPIHDRQMIVLERSDWSAWLEETGNEADLLRALPAGSLKVQQARRTPQVSDEVGR